MGSNKINDMEYQLTVEAGRTERQYWRDLWRYRELFLFLTWRDILVRYKQTIMGVAWSVLRPVLTMIVFTFVFGRLAKMPSQGAPYPIMVYSALLPWQFFATAMALSSESLVANAGMVSKIYFPRIIVPISSVMVSLIDFLVSFFVLIIIMLGYWFIGNNPAGLLRTEMLFLPLFLVMALAFAVGVGLWLSALMVQYRDIRHIVPFAVQTGLLVSPVAFSSAIVPEQFRMLYYVNPMAGVIDGFRWAILGGKHGLFPTGLWMAGGMTVLVLVGGIFFFRRMERTFADVI